jgi:hypothetical protein
MGRLEALYESYVGCDMALALSLVIVLEYQVLWMF